MKINGDKILYIIGWIAISPFILKDAIVIGVKWVYKKIKK
jgi:hypothetical protein